MAKTSVKDRPCATEGCENPAKLRLEVGGVGSDYCPECYAKIDLDAPPAPEAQPEAETVQHASDCAVHNGPAFPAGPCDCGASDQPLDGPAPETEGAPGADTTAGGAETDPDAAPVVTQGQLRDLIAKIEARNTDLHREALVRELVEDHGATYDQEAGTLTVDGITATPATKRPAQILATWCSAARRAILSGAIPE